MHVDPGSNDMAWRELQVRSGLLLEPDLEIIRLFDSPLISCRPGVALTLTLILAILRSGRDPQFAATL